MGSPPSEALLTLAASASLQGSRFKKAFRTQLILQSVAKALPRLSRTAFQSSTPVSARLIGYLLDKIPIEHYAAQPIPVLRIR